MTKLPALPVLAFLLAANAIAQELPGEPLPLIPESPVTTAKPKAQPVPAKKKSSTEQASDDLQTRIRYREAKTKALQDPRLQQEWDRAHAMKTEPERRAAMKSYYTMLCDRMVRLDPTVKTRVEALRKSLAWRYDSAPAQRAKMAKPVEEEEADVTAN